MMQKTEEKRRLIESIVRVNQAGEYGARRIYEGQLAIVKKSSDAYAKILHMKEQELEHLEYFNKKLVETKSRPTILQPIWHVAGFGLGAVTAILGEKAAFACTVAVEEVIDQHYQEQLAKLDDVEDAELKQKIEKFRLEEIEHRDTGLENDAENAIAYPVLSAAIKMASKTAIWFATRI